MDLSNLGNAVLAFGLSPLVAFAVAVVVDDVFGVVLAFKTKTFDANKLPSFLGSQFGTKAALVAATAGFAAYSTGGDFKVAATTVVVTGGSALFVSVLKDIYAKAKAILASGTKPAAATK